ncbi:probable basic-leucine zipper transcription factor F isoform X2 [Gigantopelta aegis]|nr:probable basic-leucine zipper transcription factor F isoform X2 [Gigantopelta aegis]
MSEDLGSPGNSDADLLDDEPFFQGADQDLLDYFGGGSSSDEDVSVTTKLRSRIRNKENVNLNQNVVQLKSGHVVCNGKTKTVPVRNVTPMSRPKEPSSVELSLINNNPQSSNIKSVKVVKVITTSPTTDSATEACEVIKALEDRSRKNAQQAKQNREKKKAYVQGLETDIKRLQTENNELTSKNKTLTSRTTALEEEVEYLKNVLANESSLSKLLKNIDSVKGVRLSSSFQSRKRSAALDHCYDTESPSKRPRPSTAGICLHVDKDDVSLEFCSHCSRMAKLDENK